MCVLYVSSDGSRGRLDFIQSLGFKFVEALSLDVLLTPPDIVRAHIVFRHAALQQRCAQLETKLREVNELVKNRQPSLLLAIKKTNGHHAAASSSSIITAAAAASTPGSLSSREHHATHHHHHPHARSASSSSSSAAGVSSSPVRDGRSTEAPRGTPGGGSSARPAAPFGGGGTFASLSKRFK
jgi:hypothetical protein